MKKKSISFLMSAMLLGALLSSCAIHPISSSSSSSFSSYSSDLSSLSSQSSSSISSSSFSDSSSSSNSSIRSTSTSSSSSSSSSQSSETSPYRRISPIKASGNQLSIYNPNGTVNRTLSRSSVSDSDTWYTFYEDVALYYLGFGELPANYVFGTGTAEKASAFASFGTKARLYTDYYTRTDGYMAALPTPNAYRYFEADIGGTSDYASNPKWSRGTYRLVIIPGGLKQYGTDVGLFYTTDHYDSFQECYNYAGGWSDVFDGEGSGYGNYVKPVTITL